jgi:Carboxypeptidase regulatory-like domain/TonB dependent receptor
VAMRRAANWLLRRALVLLVGSWLIGPSIRAQQSTAQIVGTVTDQSGSVLPKAQITVTQTDTGLTRTVIADQAGAFTFPDLPIGPYKLEASLTGFRTYVQTGIILQVNDSPVVNPVLSVGSVSQQVEVKSNAEAVDTENPAVSQVMDNTRVTELPLNGRQVTDLIVIAGSATVSATTAFVRDYPTENISVAGGMHNSLIYLLDGVTHNDPVNSLNLPLPFPDALQEFKLETSAQSAQYGQHSAGTVNAVTKSGTNSFHGDAFEFLRNGAVNARNFFATVPDSLKRNQYGGTFGGPFIKDKLFFFGAYQGTRIRASGVPQFATIPTPQMIAGDWTAITSPACNGGRQITLKGPFVDNMINPSLFSQQALNILKYLPVPTDPCGQVPFSVKPSTNEDIGIGRIDFQKSQKQSIFGRYMFAHLVDPPGYVPGDLLTTGTTTSGAYTTYPVVNNWQTQSLAVGDTYLLTDTLVNNFRAAAVRPTNFRGQPPAELTPEQVGVEGIYMPPELAHRILNITVSGGFSFGTAGGNVPAVTNATVWQFSDDLAWSKGRHQFGFGFDYLHSGLNSNSYSSTNGAFSFTAANTGLGLGDFMLGKVNTFQQEGVGTFDFRDNYVGIYAQDTWKVRPRLTLNLGVRWDPYLPMYWADGQMFHFQQNWFDAGLRSNVYINAPAGVLYSGDPGVPNNGKVQPNQWWHFSPRVALAWDPKGDGRTSIRAGYGLFRDYEDLYSYQMVKSSPPYNDVIVLQSPAGGLANVWAGYPGGQPFPIPLSRDSAFPTSGSWVNVPQNLAAPYVNQWNLSVERQFGSSWVASVSYLGNNVTHLINSIEANPAVYIPGTSCVINGVTYTPCSSTNNTTQRRALYLANPSQGQYYGSIVQLNAGGTLDYNGLITSLTHRFDRGLTMQANYTWSHCIDTGTSQYFGATPFGGAYTLARIAANRGNCGGLEEDRRHNFNLSLVYEIPTFTSGRLRAIGTGWQVSSILKVLTGDYFSITSGIDTSLSGITYDQRPDQVLSDPYAPQKSAALWLNPKAFAQAATGTYGTMGPRTLEGPGFFGLDMGIDRKFAIVRESQFLEVRFEGFNVLNHPNFLDPVATLTSTTFGEIQSANDPRILQLGLKYIF